MPEKLYAPLQKHRGHFYVLIPFERQLARQCSLEELSASRNQLGSRF